MRTVCTIDKKTGTVSTCILESLDEEQLRMEFNSTVIDCSRCEVYKLYKGKEKKYFSYTEWTGELRD